MPDFGTKSQGRDFPAVHGEMMYGFQLPSECRDFAELCAGKAAYPLIQVASNACDIVHRPLCTGNLMPRYLRRFTSMSQSELRWISTQANRSSRNSVVFCKNSDSCGDRATPGMPARATSYSGRYLSSKKISLPPLVSEMKYPPRFRLESLWGFERPEITSVVSPVFRSIT